MKEWLLDFFIFFEITVTSIRRYLWKNTRIFTNVLTLELYFNWFHERKGLGSPGINIITLLETMNSWLASSAGDRVCEPLRGWSPGGEKPGAAEPWCGRGSI